jgi:hypothetical protein
MPASAAEKNKERKKKEKYSIIDSLSAFKAADFAAVEATSNFPFATFFGMLHKPQN